MPRPPAVSPDVLNAALSGLELQKSRIEQQLTQVRSLLGRRGPGRPAKAAISVSTTPDGHPKRHVSAATRKKMAAAQRRRYDALKKQKGK
jgi:hypothetical protein